MSKRFRTKRPCSIQDAFRACADQVLEEKNLSKQGIAHLMAVNDWTLRKWITEGDMPAHLIRQFEFICGADYVSRWLVESAGRMVVEVPKGKKCGPHDIQQLQGVYHIAVGELMGFYEDLQNIDDTMAAIQTALEQTAWHKGNVEKYRQPELPFDEED